MEPIQVLTEVLILAVDSMRIRNEKYRSDRNARYSYLEFRAILRRHFAAVGDRVPYWRPFTNPPRRRIARGLQLSEAGSDMELFDIAARLMTAIKRVAEESNFGRRSESLLNAIDESVRMAIGSPSSGIIPDISATIDLHFHSGDTPSRVPVPGDPMPQVDAEYRVWFATNRAPIIVDGEYSGYSSERDSETHYGMCKIFVPQSHKIGSIGSPWWKRILTGVDDRLCLTAIATLATTEYWEKISLQILEHGEDFAGVIFIHGYNVSFEEAALRTAQLGFDLSIQGPMAFFSWPSKGTLLGYPADSASINASEGAITDYIVNFVEQSGALKLHIIAHSMGNRGVVAAMHGISMQARERVGDKIGQLILAAADIDSGVFQERCPAFVKLALRTTLYVSSRDRAVGASSWLYDFPRAGLMPPVVVAKDVDTVNVAKIDLTRLGHGYIADARVVLQDMHQLIFKNTSPQQRFGMRLARTNDGSAYWELAR